MPWAAFTGQTGEADSCSARANVPDARAATTLARPARERSGDARGSVAMPTPSAGAVGQEISRSRRAEVDRRRPAVGPDRASAQHARSPTRGRDIASLAPPHAARVRPAAPRSWRFGPVSPDSRAPAAGPVWSVNRVSRQHHNQCSTADQRGSRWRWHASTARLDGGGVGIAYRVRGDAPQERRQLSAPRRFVWATVHVLQHELTPEPIGRCSQLQLVTGAGRERADAVRRGRRVPACSSSRCRCGWRRRCGHPRGSATSPRSSAGASRAGRLVLPGCRTSRLRSWW